MARSSLRWAPEYQTTCIPGEAVYLLAEHATVVLDQPEALAIAAAIDGHRDADDVVDAIADASPDVDLATVFFMIDEYLGKGYLVDHSDPGSVEHARVAVVARDWRLPAPTRSDLSALIAVGGLGSGAGDAREVARALAETDLTTRLLTDSDALMTAAADRDVDFLVAVVPDYLEPRLAEIDQLRRAAGRPWLLARTAGANAWVGPVFTPGSTACWHCMVHRIRGNRDVEEYLRLRTHAGDESIRPQAAGPAALRVLGAGLVATEALHAALRPEPPPAILHTFDTATWEHQTHPVVRRPQCPECGTPEPLDAPHPPVSVDPGARGSVNESGFRAVEPRVTLDRYADHVSVITGAVTALTPVPVEGEPSLHVYAAGHNFAMRGAELKYLRAGLRTKSSGKGMTEDQAKVSALGEALERYQGLFTGEERRRTTTLGALGASGIHPNDIMLWSDRQYQDRDAWNALDRKFAVVPEPFDPGIECDFSPVWSLTRHEVRWVPTGMLYYSVPRPSGRLLFIACSNGAAAGNTREEAILQGALELVERDAVAVWWYNRLPRPEFDVSGMDDPRIHETLATYRRLGRPIALLDLTHDLGIPVVAAVSARESGVSEDILIGFGAHLDPVIAVMRAISEVTQFYPGVAGHREDGSGDYGYDDRESQEWWRTATRESEPYLVPDPLALRAPWSPTAGTVQDMAAAVRAVQSAIESRGHEVVVLDQTRPDIGFPTVKVLAPGMRHFWARYAPGRLYDVPVALGWLPVPTAEEDLNPRVMFL
ncbi:MAG: TOMM precursor leader peptide-binding protein [Actinomycetales bacterium]|nr:TOMM precursor leader peptide-binding protein [Actinomycetales bacterium]